MPAIILIDDEPSVLFALKLLLQTMRYEIFDFADPVTAVERILSGQIDAMYVICDLRMPRLNGIQVLTKLKEAHSKIPFILMSAHAGKEEIDEAKKLGAAAFIPKPFTPDDLRTILNSTRL